MEYVEIPVNTIEELEMVIPFKFKHKIASTIYELHKSNSPNEYIVKWNEDNRFKADSVKYTNVEILKSIIDWRISKKELQMKMFDII
jgi:hypothetical protein